jgi:hypothetical protein
MISETRRFQAAIEDEGVDYPSYMLAKRIVFRPVTRFKIQLAQSSASLSARLERLPCLV